MSRQAVVAVALLAVAVACGLVAAITHCPVWAAALGAGLAVVYWGLETLAWRRARRASFNGAVAVALGGMALRLAVVLGALVIVGLLDRAAFATTALCFLAGLTVYMGLRLFLFSDPGESREVRVP